MSTITLGDKQKAFVRMLADLVVFAYEEGFMLTLGDGYRDPRVHGEFGHKKGPYSAAKSVHKIKLAQDYNLFIDGEWIQSSDHEAWNVLHDYWESRGGAKRVPNDANHFSLEHWGCR